jgi:hypothetical protein
VENSAAALIDLICRKAPEYLDLLTARNDGEFETAFDAILQRAIMQLERNARKFAELDEDGLSAVLATGLSVPGLAVTRESYSNGHVDLTIDADHCVPARRKLAEAKIYDGPSYHFSGLKQLLGRYTTGRECRGLMIVYFRSPNIDGLVVGLREKMDAEKPMQQQGATSAYTLKWSFLSKHKLATGASHEVGHLGCNLFFEK